MTKEEMKNRISMALKDPILQQGFEIICKENAELKKEVEKHKWNDIFLEDCAVYDKKIAEEYTTLQERIAELEKDKQYYSDSLDKQIEATLKLQEDYKELEKELKYAEENCLFRDCPKVEKLEKENAELKDKADKCQHLADVRLEQELETYQKSYTVSREKLDTEIALDEVKDQLTKAKTYLKYFVNILKKLRASKEPLVIEAEQFLKDSEVEK